jgi:hypothetical protein
VDGLPIGSVQSWLAAALTTVGPLIAPIVGSRGPIGSSGGSSVRSAITRRWRAPRATAIDGKAPQPRAAASSPGLAPALSLTLPVNRSATIPAVNGPAA